MRTNLKDKQRTGREKIKVYREWRLIWCKGIKCPLNGLRCFLVALVA